MPYDAVSFLGYCKSEHQRVRKHTSLDQHLPVELLMMSASTWGFTPSDVPKSVASLPKVSTSALIHVDVVMGRVSLPQSEHGDSKQQAVDFATLVLTLNRRPEPRISNILVRDLGRKTGSEITTVCNLSRHGRQHWKGSFESCLITAYHDSKGAVPRTDNA
jgi:hypothetical protein